MEMLSNTNLVDDNGIPKVPIVGMELGQCELFKNSGIKQWLDLYCMNCNKAVRRCPTSKSTRKVFLCSGGKERCNWKIIVARTAKNSVVSSGGCNYFVQI